MKKFLALLVLFLCSVSVFSQRNVSVAVTDSIYDVIDNAQIRGLCGPVSGAKPYTEKKILSLLEEILQNDKKLTDVEISVINEYIDRNSKAEEEKRLGTIFFKNDNFGTPVNMEFYYGANMELGAGIYNKSKYSKAGFDITATVGLAGDIGKGLGFNIKGLFDLAMNPLTLDGDDYYIGKNWFDYIVTDDNETDPDPDPAKTIKARTEDKYISSYSNNAWLPYTHIYSTSGKFGWINKLIPSSLGEWTQDVTFYANFYTEIRANFLNDKINLGFGRIQREWAAMDKNSSLVLNRTAVPFYGIDMTVDLFPWLSYSSIAGSLENPNRPDIFTGEGDNHYPQSNTISNVDYENDAYYWQNAFSASMVEINVKRLHLDFGTTVVFPKRFELGYLFPLSIYAEYQNHTGDFDNVAMFGDIKYTQPGIGSIWFSLFSDEINDFKTKPFSGTREMFAFQTGVKVVIPNVSFGTVSMRYTKIEPYCYTHHAINYTPYYNHYICENYTNNGIGLGSYLPPNTDEILLQVNIQQTPKFETSFVYQLTRHGAEYGTQQVSGSSYYSELDNKDRDNFKKYFLHDGAYNWIHAISFNGAYTNRQTKVPFRIYGSAGFVISYFTGIDQSLYVNDKNVSEGVMKKVDFNTPYSILDTDEYPFRLGPVLSIGVEIGKF